jgi:signal peptidase I
MKGRLKSFVTGLYWVFIIALIMVVSFVVWGSRNGWQFNTILTGSMEPTFNVGGIVVVRPVDPQSLQVGDAISFRVPGMKIPVCHRIIAIVDRQGTRFLETKGDANEAADQNLVPLTDVMGKAIYHIPDVGRLNAIKNLESTRATLLGHQIPVGSLLVLGLGLVFIGLIFKDTLVYLLWPARTWRRDALKQRQARLLKRRLAYRIR